MTGDTDADKMAKEERRRHPICDIPDTVTLCQEPTSLEVIELCMFLKVL